MDDNVMYIFGFVIKAHPRFSLLQLNFQLMGAGGIYAWFKTLCSHAGIALCTAMSTL